MAIRHIVASDRQTYIDLYTATAAEARWIGGELPVDVEQLGAHVDRAIADEQTAILVATDENNAAVGHLGLANDNGVVGLGMMLEPAHRGKGVGWQLLTTAIEWAEDAGAHKLSLEVWPHNERAIALYEKAGFAIEGRRVRHYRRNSGELWDSLIMGLALPRG